MMICRLHISSRVALLCFGLLTTYERTILCYCLCYDVILHTRRAGRRKRQAQTQIPAVNERRAAARSTRNEPVHGSRPWTRLPSGPVDVDVRALTKYATHPPAPTPYNCNPNQPTRHAPRACYASVHRPLGRFAHTRLPPMRCHAPPPGTNANANAISAAARARTREHPPHCPRAEAAPSLQVRVHWVLSRELAVRRPPCLCRLLPPFPTYSPNANPPRARATPTPPRRKNFKLAPVVPHN